MKSRPLVGTIVKPKLGLNEKEHAGVAYDAWVGGLDIVKDDENLSSQSFNRFEKRVRATLRMRDRAEKETGERKMYMPNITAETGDMLGRAEFVKENGGEYAMVDIITIGWSGLQTVRNRNEELGLVLAVDQPVLRRLTADELQERGEHVGDMHHLVALDACRDAVRPADQQRRADAAFS